MKIRIPTTAVLAAILVCHINSALGQVPGSSPRVLATDSTAGRQWPNAPYTLANTQLGLSNGPDNARDAVPPLLVRFSSTDRDAAEAMEEDLTIMTHIIDRTMARAFGTDSPPSKMGIPLTYTAGGRSVRAMYLEGFGTLFTIKVNFPLVGPPRPKEKTPEPPADSEWESVKRALRGDGRTKETWSEMGLSEAEFDSTQVENLKKEVLESLKNATNIRNLKPDEFVCVTFFGTPALSFRHLVNDRATTSEQTIGGKDSHTRVPPSRGSPEGATDQSTDTQKLLGDTDTNFLKVFGSTRSSVRGSISTAGPGTVLTLRAKKADVDAFSKGALSSADFQRNASVNAYVGYGTGLDSVANGRKISF